MIHNDEIVISKEVQFDAGHRVPNHDGKCRSPHGHRYRVEVFCAGQIIYTKGHPQEGMLVDFGHLKNLMMEEIHDVLDHTFIMYVGDDAIEDFASLCLAFDWTLVEFPYIPTAENIARWCWERLEKSIAEWWDGDIRLSAIKVWETPTSMAMVS